MRLTFEGGGFTYGEDDEEKSQKSPVTPPRDGSDRGEIDEAEEEEFHIQSLRRQTKKLSNSNKTTPSDHENARRKTSMPL